MSVNIKFKPLTNESKWDAIKTGDFVVLEGIPEHPIPNGLYRTFIITDPQTNSGNIFVVPMFDGPFPDNMFPYILSSHPFPILVHKVQGITIDVEINK